MFVVAEGLYSTLLWTCARNRPRTHWFGVELSEENCKMIYAPEGFAQGYITLVDNTEMYYHTTEFYQPKSACGVRYDDPAFGIEWPIEISDISVQSYAMNQEEYGTQNILIGDKSGFKYILKKARYRYFDEINRKRISEISNLLSCDEYDSLRFKLAFGNEVEIFGQRYLFHEYLKSKNSYKKFRIRRTRKKFLFLLESAFELCIFLSRIGS